MCKSSLLLLLALAGNVSAFVTTTTPRATLASSTIYSASTSAGTPSSSTLFAALTGDNNKKQPETTASTISSAGGDFPRGPMPSSSTPSSMNSEQDVARAEKAYENWCRTYRKPYDELRVPIFVSNYLKMERYSQQTGEQVQFNEFADLTTEEYKAILQEQDKSYQQQQSRQRLQAKQQAELQAYKQSYDQQYETYQRLRAQDTGPEGNGFGSFSTNTNRPAPPPMPRNALERSLAENNPQGYLNYVSVTAYVQTSAVGAIIGTLCVFPISAIHYLSLVDYSYTTYAQWEWDLIAATIQGALFANVFRYSVRTPRDLNNSTLFSRVLWAFIIIKALVRVTVTPDCASNSLLYCAEPWYLVNDHMLTELFINVLESVALFGPTAYVMRQLLQTQKIRPFDE